MSLLPVPDFIQLMKQLLLRGEFDEVQDILLAREKDLRTKMENIERDRDSRLEAKLLESQKECEELREKIRLDELSNEHSEVINERNKMISGLNEKVDELKSEVLQKTLRLRVSEENFKCLDSRVTELITHNENVRELKRQKLEACKTAEELGRQKMEADRMIEDLKRQKIESGKMIEELTRQKVEAERTAEDLRGQKLGADQMVEDLKRQKMESYQMVEELKRQKMKADKTIESYKKRRDQVIQNNVELKSQNSEATKAIEELKQEIDMYKVADMNENRRTSLVPEMRTARVDDLATQFDLKGKSVATNQDKGANIQVSGPSQRGNKNLCRPPRVQSGCGSSQVEKGETSHENGKKKLQKRGSRGSHGQQSRISEGEQIITESLCTPELTPKELSAPAEAIIEISDSDNEEDKTCEKPSSSATSSSKVKRKTSSNKSTENNGLKRKGCDRLALIIPKKRRTMFDFFAGFNL